MSDKYELSRRKALAALGTIGVAGAGAGMGTSALFSDEESFENNTITAGTTNLVVSAAVVRTDSTADLTDTSSPPYVTIRESDNTADQADAALGLEAVDIKPGDSFTVKLDVDVENNPMYVALEASNATDSEGTNTDPEPSPGPDSGDDSISGEGDLDNRMDVTVGWDNTNPNNNSFEGSIAGPEFSGSLTDFMQISQLYRGRQGDGGSPPGGHGGSGAQATRIGGSDPDGYDSGSESDQTLADVDRVTTYAQFSLPDTVGNEVQGDSAQWDLTWYAEQVRNNATPSGPSDVIDGTPN